MPAQRWRGGKNARPRAAAQQAAGAEVALPPQQASAVPQGPPALAGGNGRKEAGPEDRHADIFTKTKMCKFHLLGLCSKGTGCHFAHAREDLNPLPDLYRTKLCKSLINTGQCNDATCKYAHNREELRSPGIPAPRAAARAPKGEKAARGRAKGQAKPAQRGGAKGRGGGAEAPSGNGQGEEGEKQIEPQSDQAPLDQKEVMMRVPVMTYPVMGLPGNRAFQLVMQQPMAGSPTGGMSPYGMVVPHDKSGQMWYCLPQRSPDDGGSSTTAKSAQNQNPQDPSRSSSHSGSDGSYLEPPESASGTPPPPEQMWGVCMGGPPMTGESISPSGLAMQGKIPEMLYSPGVPGVTVKNTFLEFEPVKPSGGLRTVHTASGRLDLLGEEDGYLQE